MFVNLGAVGGLRRKLNHWDMQEDVDFLQSCVTGAPHSSVDHSK